LTRKRRARTVDNILSGGEVKIVLGAIENQREEMAIKAPMFSGFRRGELVHMTEDWIQRGKIRVPIEIPCDCWECKKPLYRKVKKKNSKKTVKVLKKPSGVWMPKTKAGARGIPLNPLSEELFKKFFKEHHAVREILPCTRSVYYTVHDIVYPRIKDQLTHELFPHVLRGVFASRLAETGISPYKLAEIMGWEDIKTAMAYIALFGPQEEAEGLTIESFVNV